MAHIMIIFLQIIYRLLYNIIHVLSLIENGLGFFLHSPKMLGIEYPYA